MRRLSAVLTVAAPLALAAAVVGLEAWHGPIVLALTERHGIDAGDLFALPLVVATLAIARRRFAAEAPAPRIAAAAAALLGALLLFAGIVRHDGGPLVPAGGGTLDGTIAETFASRPVPVDRWTNVALTYDGARERLYVDGRVVSSRVASGRIQVPMNPLWIGGNRPYGEHFAGTIDEVRVYRRALSRREIRADMATPVHPADGLVAAYGFDDGPGRVAADGSGAGHTGELLGAPARVAGRFGRALRFDGRATVVRVPPSPSLAAPSAMTLSAWIRPSAEQDGWRTIVQRQTDAFFLTAGSAAVATTYGGLADTGRVLALLAAAAWFGWMVATARTGTHRRWWAPIALFALGALIDAVLVPTGTLVGPMLVGAWFAVTVAGRARAAAFALFAAACGALTFASLADVPAVAGPLYRNEGGSARTVAFGVLFLMTALASRKVVEVARLRIRS